MSERKVEAKGADDSSHTTTVEEVKRWDWTALIFAVCGDDIQLVESILSGPDALEQLDRADCDGNTALIYAAARECELSVAFLLAAGADLTACNDAGDTALHVAARTNKDRKVLVRILAADSKTNSAEEPTFRGGKESGLLETKNKQGWTPLLCAVHSVPTISKAVSVVQLLLDSGADPNAATPSGLTALMLALGSEWDSSAAALDATDSDAQSSAGHNSCLLTLLVPLVESLIDAGADVNCCNTEGHSPLLIAAGIDMCGDAVITLLLHANASVNHCATSTRDTPLIIAASYPGMELVISKLLHSKADINAKNCEGESAMSIATELGPQGAEIVRLLCMHMNGQ